MKKKKIKQIKKKKNKQVKKLTKIYFSLIEQDLAILEKEKKKLHVFSKKSDLEEVEPIKNFYFTKKRLHLCFILLNILFYSE
jgi:hypothetical protein